jgi:hypothetical protein
MESGGTYQPDPTDTWTSFLSYDPRESLYEAYIHDGQSRDVFYAENLEGEITQRDTGTQNGLGKHFNGVGPHARYYYFGGIRMGDVSNDGTSDVNYVTSITDHDTKPGTGLFQNGGTTETKYADFDASYDPINGLTYEDAPGSYTVQGGDTLQSIAQALWGDSNFWYLLADANGLDLSDMPAVPVLSDGDLAGVATYLRKSWGNRADPVSKKEVSDLRRILRPRR